MRKKFVLFILVPLIVVAAAVYLFIDGWVEAGIESAGEAVVGARVEVDQLHVTLSPVGLRFERLQVANPKDPWKNLFETGRVNFRLDFNQLLWGKFIIDSIEVSNLILGTKRTTDGSLPKPPAPPPSTETAPPLTQQFTSYAAKETKKAPVFDVAALRQSLNIDSLLNVQNLQTVRYLDSIKQQALTLSNQWKTTLTEVDAGKQKLRTVESTIKSINVNELKTLPAITGALTKAKEAYGTVNDLNKTFQSRKASVTSDVQRLTGSLAKVDDLVRSDIQNVQRLARLPDLSLGGIANLLAGPGLLDEIDTYLGYVELAHSTVKKYSPKPEMEKPRRFEGQNIRFPVERGYPKFWIRRIHVSGGTDRSQNTEYFYATGDAHDITSNQDVTGVPTTVRLTGDKAGRTTFLFDASLDRRGDTSLDRFRVAMLGIPVGQLPLGRSEFLPTKITESLADVNTQILVPSGKIDATTKITFRNIHLVFDRQPRNAVERIARDVLEQIKTFFLSLRLWNTSGPMDVAFASDLDDQIAARARKVIGDEIAKIQNDIRAKVNARIAAKRQEVTRLIDQKKREVLSRINEYENQLKQRVAQVQAKEKELEKRVEDEKKKQTEAVKKKAEDAAKGLLKKLR